jgi:hypothetical protein
MTLACGSATPNMDAPWMTLALAVPVMVSALF